MAEEKEPMNIFEDEMKVKKTITERGDKGTVYKVKSQNVVGNPGDPDYLKVVLSIETADSGIFSHMPRDSLLEVSIVATQVTLEEAEKLKQKHL